MFPNLVLSGLPPVTRCNTAVTTSGGQGSILVSDGSACHLIIVADDHRRKR